MRKNRRRYRKNEYGRKQLFLIVELFSLLLILLLALGRQMYRERANALPAGAMSEVGNEDDGFDVVKEEPQPEPVTTEMAEIVQNENLEIRSGTGEMVADYVSYCELDEVETPAKRKPYQVGRKLEELSAEYPLIAEVCKDLDAYPDKLLEALANNPEMADFVIGYPYTDQSVSGGLTELEMQQEYPLFLQWDPRWGYVSYGGDSNIGLAGCGPVSLSMALYYLNRDASVTPDKIAAYAMENDYYMFGTGTRWALVEDFPRLHGVRADELDTEEALMKERLKNGEVLICAVRPGDFTAAGHFLVIYGYNEDGFLISDPNCVARSRKSWKFNQIDGQIKQIWSLGKMA